MHVTVVCPACQSQYQVDPSLRGKRMRCPNTICRTVFEVADDAGRASAPPVQPAAPPKPVVEKPRPKPPEPATPPAWSAPPPVRNAATVPLPSPVDDLDFPGDFPEDEPEPTSAPAAVVEPPAPPLAPPKARRRPLLIVGLAMLVLVALAGAVAYRFIDREYQVEGTLAAQADDVYGKGDFAEAMRRFQQLQREYPESNEAGRYRFLATLSEFRAEVDAAAEPATLIDAVRHGLEFLDTFQDNSLFKANEADIFSTLLLLAKRTVRAAQDGTDAALLTQAETLWARTRLLFPNSGSRDDDFFRTTFTDVRKTIADQSRRRDVLAKLRDMLENPTAANVVLAQKIIADAGLATDPEVAAALKALRDALKARIVFVPATAQPSALPADPFATIPVVAAVRAGKAARGRDPVLALSPTGVLFALHPRTGELAWAQRLGIDSHLPPKLIDDPAAAPRCLAISNDNRAVALLDVATGAAAWRRAISAPAAAEPTIVAGRILVPLVTGRLDVIDLATGKLAGFFQLDQPVGRGGVLSSAAPLVVLPGQAHCLYVLDLAKLACIDMIESRHVPGSLSGPPLVMPREGDLTWIILAQAEPGPRVRLRPIPYPPAASKRTEKDVVIPGTLSAAPYHDAESILLATDEGTLHQIGLRLPGNNRDPLLFPLTPAMVALEASPRGRAMMAQIAHVDAENIWAVSGGRLQRLQKSLSPTAGPTVKTRWPGGVPLGEPLHAGRAHADAEGVTLFLTARDPAGPAARVSAIDGETGKTLWQTQLGSTPRGEPIVVGGQLVWDDAAGIYHGPLDGLGEPQAFAKSEAFTPIASAGSKRSVLLPLGNSCVRVAWSANQNALHIAQYDVETAAIRSTRDVKLPAAPAGPPLLIDSGLVVPLASGVLVRVDLASGAALSGPDWRAADAPRDAVARLLRLGSNRLIAADGKGGLVAYDWSKTWMEVARHRAAESPLVGPFALLPGEEPRVVAAAGTKLILLDTARLQTRGDWPLGGAITAGPFISGENVLVVVDGKRLIAIDPTQKEPRWQIAFLADIAVAPVRIGDRLVIADVQGNFWTLNPSTGANQPPGDVPALSLRANLVPATVPVVLPSGKLFVIWSDGTAGTIALP